MTTWTPRQQKAHRKALVKVLRSDKYTQARGHLHNPETGGFCCLGVACDISKLGKWDGVEYVVGDSDRNTAILPDAVRDWLGFRDHTGVYYGNWGRRQSLAFENDNGASFDQIADIIEREPPGLIAKAGA